MKNEREASFSLEDARHLAGYRELGCIVIGSTVVILGMHTAKKAEGRVAKELEDEDGGVGRQLEP